LFLWTWYELFFCSANSWWSQIRKCE